ncbi:MAG: Flp pilus assembly complex ATPase component TadA, partial [Deltaproteobacteria bacterium]|nr:Flp pilus assembly complex ATPase component TadA [Deltaproteobacteria bacterium]
QDPDVIMVGEIRDRETADITIRAAITGHLVFSTLHTNTAIGAITRLHDLGVERFMTASAVIGLIAQRLIRCICPSCAEPATVDPEKRSALGIPISAKVMRGRGCPACRMSGYAGRVALFEMIVVTPELRRLMVQGAKEEELMAEAERSGTTSLRRRGCELILEGKTTVEEVLRVTEE